MLGWAGAGLVGAGAMLPVACSRTSEFGVGLEDGDSNGLRLPKGFSSRIVARSGELVEGTKYVWHAAPDGGAVFATKDGGWVYVSNSEVDGPDGGVGAIRFASDGSILDAYSILRGTDRNCAGGATPWNTWLSCEETALGLVYECDPLTPGSQGIARPALGTFQHEAAAVDPIRKRIYLTEDETDGLLYRFSPTSYPDLSAGRLEAAEILDPKSVGVIQPGEQRTLAWHVVGDPSGSSAVTRAQVEGASRFNGGEGCVYRAGHLFLSTKGDDRIWSVDMNSDRIEILYDRATSPTPILSGVDNLFAAPSGEVYVAEDPGHLQIVALTPSGQIRPLVQITGQVDTEVTGPALSPDGRHLYFSSQRHPGTTYEVTGPF
jgi:uncharacterized protein